MRLQLVQGAGKRQIEIRRENSSRQPAHDEIGEAPVALADVIRRLKQFSQYSCPILARVKEMFDHEREVLSQPLFSGDKPIVPLKPSLPFAELDLLGQDGAALHFLRKDASGDPTNALIC